MRDSNLTDYLNTFLKEDWKGFRTFTRAHIKDGSDLDMLIEHIYKYNQNLNQPQLDTDYICKKLYKGKSRKTVLNLYSQATALVKDYMIQDELSREDYFRQIFLLKAYNRRLLFKKADKLALVTTNSKLFKIADLKTLGEMMILNNSFLHVLHLTDQNHLALDAYDNMAFFNKNFNEAKHEFIDTTSSEMFTTVHHYIENNDIKMLAIVNKKHSFLERLFTTYTVEKFAFKIDIPFLVMQMGK